MEHMCKAPEGQAAHTAELCPSNAPKTFWDDNQFYSTPRSASTPACEPPAKCMNAHHQSLHFMRYKQAGAKHDVEPLTAPAV